MILTVEKRKRCVKPLSMERFGHYTLIKKIAQGGMADIYLAQQRGIKRFRKPIIIKKLFPNQARQLSVAEMFFNEARLLAWFNHPNIVQVFDLGTIEDTHYIAMEFVDGPSLKGLIEYAQKRGIKLPLPVVLFIIFKISCALTHIHSLRDREGNPVGLVHRDINPQNIMINSSGTPKLLDFGVASSGKATTTGAGTVGYMSPEQYSGEILDGRSDIFSLGIVFYECVTSRHPFFDSGDPEQIVIQKTFNLSPPPPSNYNPLCDSELDDIIQKCIAKDKNNRFKDAEELSNTLFNYMKKKDILLHEGMISVFLKEITGSKYGPRVWPVDLEDEREELGNFLFDDLNKEKKAKNEDYTITLQEKKSNLIDGEAGKVFDANKKDVIDYRVLVIIESILLFGILIYLIVK